MCKILSPSLLPKKSLTAMPHVFNRETSEFEQIHYWKVSQRPTGDIKKRQRTQESVKFYLALEEEQTKKTETRAARRAALQK